MKKTVFNLGLLFVAAMMIFTSCEDNKNKPEPELKEYAVFFNSNGGSEVANQRVKEGAKLTKPTDPTKTNHTFAGWYKESALTNAWKFETDVVTKDITLYAKWTSNMPTDPGVYVTFGDGTSWKAAVVKAEDIWGYNLLRIEAGKTSLTAYPYLEFIINNSVGVTQYDGTGCYFYYYESKALTEVNSGEKVGQWWDYFDLTPTLTVLNYEGNTVTATGTIEMFNADERYVQNREDFATKTLTIQVVDVPVTPNPYGHESRIAKTVTKTAPATYQKESDYAIIMMENSDFVAELALIPFSSTSLDGIYTFAAFEDLQVGKVLKSIGVEQDGGYTRSLLLTKDAQGRTLAVYFLTGGKVTISNNATSINIEATSYYGSRINLTGALSAAPQNAPAKAKGIEKAITLPLKRDLNSKVFFVK